MSAAPSAPISAPIDVVGIGADGWAGLTGAAQTVLSQADVIIGGPRQLALLPPLTAQRMPLPTPLRAGLGPLLAAHRDARLAVLASGDPMFFGIGSTLIELCGPERVLVHTHPSSVSLAAARLGWAVEDLDVVSLVGRPFETVHPYLQPGRRLLILVGRRDAPAAVRGLLRERGFGGSAVTVLSQLGGPQEQVGAVEAEHDPLTIVAVQCVAAAATNLLPRTPGLPDDAFEHDGQITKREIRALTLAALVPIPGQLLWDVGAGSGSVGIEWMRVHPASRAIAVEPRPERRERIARNARALGVPALRIVPGAAPSALDGLPTPDAIFVGGAVSEDGVLSACLAALPVGGRLVANGVTVQTETVLADWHARCGGTLTRLAIQRAEPIGGFTGWSPARPITQWTYRKDQS